MRRLASLIVSILLLATRLAVAQTAPHLNFLALGDWGLDSPDRQQVANAMADYADHSKQPINAALSLGDNFYVPLTSAEDPEFTKLFENTYDVKRLNFPFYILPGNHDYESLNGHSRYEWEIKYAVIHPQSRWKMPARYYRLDLPADHPLVTVLMLDSNKDNAGKYPNLTAQEWTDELAWMNQQLAGPRAAWTICCAHHTAYSNAGRGDNGVLIQQWSSLFEKYKVDVYLCGHDHSLQHIEVKDLFTSYVVSGGGGAKRDAMLRDNRGPFSRSLAGFAAFSFDPDMLTVNLIGEDGTVLHTFTRTKAGVVTVTHTTLSDLRTTQPLRLIQGFDVAPRPASQPAQ